MIIGFDVVLESFRACSKFSTEKLRPFTPTICM